MRCPACSADVRIGDATCAACGWNLNQLFTGQRRSPPAAPTEEASQEAPDVASAPRSARVHRAARAIHGKLAIGTQLGAKLRLDECDRLFRYRYDLGAVDPSLLSERTQICETIEEFLDLLLEHLRCSAAERAAILEAWVEQPYEGFGSALGVHLPGRGCFVNGWVFLRAFKCDDIDELLEHPVARAEIARTAVHEKLGHGFVSEATASGRERVANGLELLRLARRFGVETADTPDHAILNRKDELVFRASAVTDEGFSRWLETDLLSELGIGLRPEDPEALAKIDHRIASFVEWAYDPPADPSHASYHADFLQDADDDEGLCEQIRAVSESKQAPRYTLGFVLMDALAQRHGPELVPASILIAYNVVMNLDSLAVADLRELLKDSSFNITARACQLLTLPPCDDAASLAEAARELLSLTPPECLLPR